MIGQLTPVAPDECEPVTSAGDAHHGDRDVERVCDDVVVGDRRRSGGRGTGRRVLLIRAERRGQPGGAEPEVRADRSRVRRVVERVGTGTAVDGPPDVDAVAERDDVVAVAGIDVDDAGVPAVVGATV